MKHPNPNSTAIAPHAPLQDWFLASQSWQPAPSTRAIVALGAKQQIRLYVELLNDGSLELVDATADRRASWRADDRPLVGDLRRKITNWFDGERLTLNPTLVPSNLDEAIDLIEDEDGRPEWIELFDPAGRWEEEHVIAWLNARGEQKGFKVKELRWESLGGAWVDLV